MAYRVRVLACLGKSGPAQVASVRPMWVEGVLPRDVLVLHARFLVRERTCVHAWVGLEFFFALWWWWWCALT